MGATSQSTNGRMSPFGDSSDDSHLFPNEGSQYGRRVLRQTGFPAGAPSCSAAHSDLQVQIALVSRLRRAIEWLGPRRLKRGG
jgi:hypothetical protein